MPEIALNPPPFNHPWGTIHTWQAGQNIAHPGTLIVIIWRAIRKIVRPSERCANVGYTWQTFALVNTRQSKSCCDQVSLQPVRICQVALIDGATQRQERRMFRIGAIYEDMLHLQETFSDVVKTDKTGLSKTAHTRWMISAFANFLPGSTIFRLA